MAKYIGFSTVGKVKPPYALYDVELIKQDLLNHFSTRIGERVMRPNYGSRVYDYLHDPQDGITHELMLDDIRRVISTDPRVSLDSVSLIDSEHSIVIRAMLTYLDFDKSEEMLIKFSKEDE